MPKRAWFPLLAFVFACLMGGESLAQNLVSNPGFEASDLSAWTITTDSPDGAAIAIYNSLAFSGTQCVYFAQTGYFDHLTQTISTLVGQTYTLTFMVAANPDFTPSPGAVQQFEVFWGGTRIYSRSDNASHPYQQISVLNLSASGASTLLTFSGRNDPGAYYLDDVSLTASGMAVVPVPESSTWVVAAAAAAWLVRGCFVRRRRPTGV